MDELTNMFVRVYLVIVLFDVRIVSDARRLLLDFLIGQRNRKNAKKIHSEQSFKDKIHMGYILPMLAKNKESFKKYHVLYLAVIYSLIPQYIALWLFNYLVPSLSLCLVGLLFLIRIADRKSVV